MSSHIKIRSFFLILSVFALVSAFVFVITTCKSPADDHINVNSGNLEDTPDGDTRLVVAMHDAPFKMEGRDVQELNLTVLQMVIIDSNDNHITILNEERRMELLSVSRNDPVILSDVSVAPGTYKELRLVLKDNSTIKVDGEVYPIKIPSGSQSGLKLKGPFVIPRGKLFRLTIDFVAAESVHWNKGQGWMLKPVLRISSAAEIIGIFRGNLTVSGSLGACETLLQLYSDNTARMRVADYPNYTLNANYAYDSLRKNISLVNISLDAPGLKKRELKKVMKRLPDSITLPVKQWSLDSIISVDINGMVCNLYRVDSFDFSAGVTFTEFILNVDYPDASKTGKDVITEIRFIDTGMPPITLINEFEGSRITETVQVLNSYIQGSSTRIQITSYLFNNPDDMNIEPGLYASIPTVLMAGSYFSETTANPWQKADIFTLIRDGENQEFTVKFPPGLHIKMNHENFTNNAPVVSWDAYPGAKGYFVMVLVEEKDKTAISAGSDGLAIAFYKYTKETQVMVNSERIRFTPVHSTIGTFPPSIAAGDKIRIEVFVLDGTGILNTYKYQGALLMDAVTVKVKE